jgi:hypothetical protein
MSEGEHTIIGKIPRERLNQIASRKLSALGLTVRLGADRESLEGELAFSHPVLHPITGQPVARARFQVLGHDRLRFLDGPLAGLGAVDFYVHERLPALEQAVLAALGGLAARLQDLTARMRLLRLEPVVDPERLVARAVVKTPGHAFEILGAPDGARVSRVAPVGGRPWDVAPAFPALDLSLFQGSVDLELWLVDALPRMADRAGGPAAAPGGAPVPPTAELVATAPPRNAPTLEGLVRVFGPEAVLSPNGAIELVQEYRHGGTRYRFVATRESGTLFKGRLIGPGGDVWSDKFELASFPGTATVVARALGLQPPGSEVPGAPERPGASDASGGAVPPHLRPAAGEIWVMSVVVEKEGPEEVRYVGTDIDGRPYGAARVLSRTDFETVFSKERGGWRLLVRIDQVQDGSVLYRQIDRQRQPIGAPRRIPSAILVANFVPEAAAY